MKIFKLQIILLFLSFFLNVSISAYLIPSFVYSYLYSINDFSSNACVKICKFVPLLGRKWVIIDTYRNMLVEFKQVEVDNKLSLKFKERFIAKTFLASLIEDDVNIILNEALKSGDNILPYIDKIKNNCHFMLNIIEGCINLPSMAINGDDREGLKRILSYCLKDFVKLEKYLAKLSEASMSCKSKYYQKICNFLIIDTQN